MTSTPSPDLAAAAGEGTERPDTDAEQLRAAADWFDTFDKMGRAFFAFLARSTMSDEMRAGAEALIPTFDGDEVQTDLRRIADRLDALTPQPPVPPQGTERPDTAALLTIGDWLLRTLPGHPGAEQTAAALAYTARWIDAQPDAAPPAPSTPAPQAEPGSLVLGPEDRFHLWTKLYGIQQEAGLCRFGGRNYDPRLDHIYEEVTTALAYFEPPATPPSTPDRPASSSGTDR